MIVGDRLKFYGAGLRDFGKCGNNRANNRSRFNVLMRNFTAMH